MSSDECQLSLQGRAFSTILTAVIGSMVTGVTQGPVAAFMAGWICWLAPARLLIISSLGLAVTIFGPCFGIRQPYLAALPAAADDVNGQAVPLEVVNEEATASEDANDEPTSRRRNRDVTFLGSVGYIFTFIYTPVMQILWVSANWYKAPSILLLSRAVASSVTALSYTIDTQARYGTALGKKVGSNTVVPRLMNLYTAVINMLLSIIVVLLLIHGAAVASESFDDVKWVAIPYTVFSLVWASGSFKIFWPSDEGLTGASFRTLCTCDGRAIDSLKEIGGGLFVGALAGLFVAFPSIVMSEDAEFEQWGQDHGFASDSRFTDGQNLSSWLLCTTDSWWKKAVQILP